MLNPNAKTFTFNPTATSSHFNAASTLNESEGGVQETTTTTTTFSRTPVVVSRSNSLMIYPTRRK